MRYASYIVGASLLLLLVGGCSNRPVDAENICRAALEGVEWGNGAQYSKCLSDVSWAAYHAGHAAAEPYRQIKR